MFSFWCLFFYHLFFACYLYSAYFDGLELVLIYELFCFYLKLFLFAFYLFCAYLVFCVPFSEWLLGERW